MLGPVPFERDGWQWHKLANGLVLSRCESLEMDTTADAAGKQWTLLGLAAQTEPGELDPIEAIASSQQSLVETTRTWTGRWVLIGPDRLCQDASGLLGCYYRTIESGATAGLWISSSVALLASLPGAPSAGSPQGELGWGVGIDWFPPPASRYPGVRRVLATQILRLAGDGVEFDRKPVPQPLDGAYDSDALCDMVERRMVTAIRSISRMSDGPLWIALTAGADSRLVLATAAAAGIDAVTYTQELPFHRWGQGLADRRLPPKLAREVGMDHHLVKAQARSNALLELWDSHTAGQSIEADREFLARRQWDALPTGSIVIRAGVFEVAQDSEYPFLPPTDHDRDFMMQALEAYASRFGRSLTDYQRAALSEWLDWLVDDSKSTVDWRDWYYYEQRVGGWLSSIEQGIDCTERRSLQVANCTALLEELMTFEQDLRVNGKHHRLLIERMAPELLKHPINPDDGRLVQLAAKLTREGYRIANREDGDYLRNLGQRIKRKIRN